MESLLASVAAGAACDGVTAAQAKVAAAATAVKSLETRDIRYLYMKPMLRDKAEGLTHNIQSRCLQQHSYLGATKIGTKAILAPAPVKANAIAI